MSEPFIGEIRMAGFNFAPYGWAFCDGSLLSIAQNTPLFALLGTSFGGNGVQTFGLPDLRSRVPIGATLSSAPPGLTPRQLGEKAGSENFTLTAGNTPVGPHTHAAASAVLPAGSSNKPDASSYLAGATDTDNGVVYSSFAPDGPEKVTLAPNSVVVQQATGGPASTQIPTLPPYLGVNFIIALQGIFPSRG
ncbi:phage tail protein [Derxia gummosa]|uniref:Phage tail protein n=1 Tax=Derxia gummosa DSM 723 TaxID=1121388 RepID=A0A8B6X0N6_9BURK|nr:tail fiber protein [Derxia gummosa]